MEDSKIVTPIKAQLLTNRVIVWNPKAGSYLYKNGFFGKPVGIRKPKVPEFDRPLELSLLETAYLLQEKKIELANEEEAPISLEEFKKRASMVYDGFLDKLIVYMDLRRRGYVVRPGLKFGADFAVYEHGPGIDHSPFLVHVIPSSARIPPIEMVRAGRLATTVRKKFIIATIKRGEEAKYYAFTWFKP
ncbi:MAG: tRNA-intron lyase [Candidatus Odinarchaeum yellowstonii]|uniref:tRNA-intron lyase n=1 Tax=Odinarchaeota yellowstonii (strain LCB_4) TaxID=1841599 RepID=A0AAF0D2S8_ODILC|nr:MAG: tRNA-intron lyase [Candidatus Odinarchaeum yellowstonii]